MQIGGFQKTSLIDYPGKVASVIFTQGCNFRCPFCHNRDLVEHLAMKELLAEAQVLGYLAFRRDKIQGVVVTGGEPTLQPDLLNFLAKLKALGYAVKLDTNGSRPDVLREALRLKLVDFVAMDIKAPLQKYASLAGVSVDLSDIQVSRDLILSSGIEHQFRTTAVKPLLDESDLEQITQWLGQNSCFTLQDFSATSSVLDQSLLDRGHHTPEEFNALKEKYQRGVLVSV
jgi:pyruvate formate lyase activating enzyme